MNQKKPKVGDAWKTRDTHYEISEQSGPDRFTVEIRSDLAGGGAHGISAAYLVDLGWPDGDKPLPDPQIQLARALHLARLALAFSRVPRATLHEDGVRVETDADHTVMLGLLAMDLAPLTLDRGLVQEFVLIHDLPEVTAGDRQTLQISEADRRAKEVAEAAARAQLGAELGAASTIVQRLLRYEAQIEPEARFVRLLDKVLPKLTHAFNGCAAAKPIVGSLANLRIAHSEQYGRYAAEYSEFPELLALLKASMEAAEAAWGCPVCGAPPGCHLEGSAPGQLVIVPGLEAVPCAEVPVRDPVAGDRTLENTERIQVTRDLERLRLVVLRRNRGEDSPEERVILERMDAIWWELTAEEVRHLERVAGPFDRATQPFITGRQGRAPEAPIHIADPHGQPWCKTTDRWAKTVSPERLAPEGFGSKGVLCPYCLQHQLQYLGPRP